VAHLSEIVQLFSITIPWAYGIDEIIPSQMCIEVPRLSASITKWCECKVDIDGM